jgi:Flp pilus assembly protein TadG
MKSATKRPCQEDSGFVLFMFMVITAVLLTSVAFTVDMGRAYDEQRQLQIVADSAALAAVSALGSGTSYTRILSIVAAIAEANGATIDEIMENEPLCGTWEEGEFIQSNGRSCPSSANAVEVNIKRTVPTRFAQLMNQHSMTLRASAVAYLPPPEGGNCIRPFGIEESHLETLNVSEGDTFSVSGSQGMGNWGKIDLGGNASSGKEYTQLMLTKLCNEAIAPGNFVSSGTGNAQINQVFQALLEDTTPPLAASNMVFAVTSDFGSGNSQVQIQRFVKVNLLSQEGSGSKWRANFQVVEWDTQPDPPVSPSRRLMR